MKIKQYLLALATITFVIGLNSCKKTGTAEDWETTFELSGDQAITDNLTQDANDVFMEVAVDNNIAGNFAPGPVTNIIPCASISITPANSFPKTIVIDFGTACTHNGITRSGIINIVLTDSVRKSGSVATMTFSNYYVNLYKVEGTYTWTNTSLPGTVSWTRRTENGKITSPNNNYWLHSGLRTVTQTGGVGTATILDDVFSINGTHSITNAQGATRDITVLENLQKKTACANIDKGKMKVQGPSHYAIIDFGDGTCDNIATISIDGRTPRTIILR